MKDIIDKFDNLPNIGKIENQVVSGLFSKKEEVMYICPKGHKNNQNVEFCETCGRNIKGLTYGNIQQINAFRAKVSALGDIIKKNERIITFSH